MRLRSAALIVKDGKVLMVKMCAFGREFYALPGGGIEQGETPEAAAIRELKEECNVDGRIVRALNTVHRKNGDIDYVFLVELEDGQEPDLGSDPESEKQILTEVCWKRLDELSEKDRAFLWSYGLLDVDGFFDEVIGWGDEISYPNK